MAIAPHTQQGWWWQKLKCVWTHAKFCFVKGTITAKSGKINFVSSKSFKWSKEWYEKYWCQNEEYENVQIVRKPSTDNFTIVWKPSVFKKVGKIIVLLRRKVYEGVRFTALKIQLQSFLLSNTGLPDIPGIPGQNEIWLQPYVMCVVVIPCRELHCFTSVLPVLVQLRGLFVIRGKPLPMIYLKGTKCLRQKIRNFPCI